MTENSELPEGYLMDSSISDATGMHRIVRVIKGQRGAIKFLMYHPDETVKGRYNLDQTVVVKHPEVDLDVLVRAIADYKSWNDFKDRYEAQDAVKEG